MFTPVDPAIKEKVISAYLAGHGKKGRNQITRELHEQGIKVSHGSISNIINAYKRKHEQPKPSPNGDDATKSTAVPMNIAAAGSPLLNGIGKATTNSNVNSKTDFVTVKRNEGGPLSYFLPSDTDMDTTKNGNVKTNSNRTSIITDKERYLDYSDMIQQYNEPIPDIDFADYPESDVYTDPNADYDEGFDGIKGERRFNYQHTNTINPFPNNFNQQSSRPHVIEETKETSEEELDQASNSLGMDWDENHEARFVKWVMDEKRLRQEQERKLQEQWGLLINERNSLEEQKRNNEAREAKIFEVKNLIPSAQQLKEMGAQFSQIQAFIYCVREKAAAAMIDERTAAWELVKDLELYNVIGGLQKAVAEKSAQLALLTSTLEQQKKAIATLVQLQKIGITTTEKEQLVNLVGGWSGKNNGGNMPANA